MSSSIGLNAKEEEKIRETIQDATANLYEQLSENDYFAGLWRRRCMYLESNAAVSFEQNGMWQVAQSFYEQAQSKARAGVLPFLEYEYCLWESRWVQCTKQLQQWDILIDFAKHDSNPDLLLECSWRAADWATERESIFQTLQAISNPPTVRKKTFESFLAILRLNENSTDLSDFSKSYEEGVQLALKKWHSLPEIISNTHIPTLHEFQQYVELQEAVMMQQSLILTNFGNIEQKSQELKGTLTTWRDRMPNQWDDISIWSDLVAWRSQFFGCVNKAYLPHVNQTNVASNGSPQNSHAYRGYHEIAWIINRFAHVARKHNLADVCTDSLTKIYTLPNIEVQEASFKLQEHAKCHLFLQSDYAGIISLIFSWIRSY